MEKQYSINIQTESDKLSYLGKGYIKCDVFQKLSPSVQRSFLYCLHCVTLGSPSWFFEHKKKEAFNPSREMVDRYRINIQRYVDDIQTEIDFLHEVGRLFPEHLQPPIHNTETASQNQETARPIQDSAPHFGNPITLEDQQHIPPNDDEWRRNEDGVPTFSAEDICDCFSRLCFDSRYFDPTPFCFLSRIVFGGDHSDISENDVPIARLKGKIVSALLRKTFVKLSLSKHQMDSLNRLIRAIVIFLSPSNVNVSNYIHSGYLSCLRESTKREDETRSIIDQSFQSCRFFSLAFDTALFGAEHVMSCIVRFTFEDKMTSFRCS